MTTAKQQHNQNYQFTNFFDNNSFNMFQNFLKNSQKGQGTFFEASQSLAETNANNAKNFSNFVGKVSNNVKKTVQSCSNANEGNYNEWQRQFWTLATNNTNEFTALLQANGQQLSKSSQDVFAIFTSYFQDVVNSSTNNSDKK